MVAIRVTTELRATLEQRVLLGPQVLLATLAILATRATTVLLVMVVLAVVAMLVQLGTLVLLVTAAEAAEAAEAVLVILGPILFIVPRTLVFSPQAQGILFNPVIRVVQEILPLVQVMVVLAETKVTDLTNCLTPVAQETLGPLEQAEV